MLNPEHMLLPYSLSDLPAGPWLVFAPHADDETYGMGGTLLRWPGLVAGMLFYSLRDKLGR